MLSNWVSSCDPCRLLTSKDINDLEEPSKKKINKIKYKISPPFLNSMFYYFGSYLCIVCLVSLLVESDIRAEFWNHILGSRI